MFLVTPDFTVRVERVIKIVPKVETDLKKKGYDPGTLVYVQNVIEGKVDREFTSLPYKEVVKILSLAIEQR